MQHRKHHHWCLGDCSHLLSRDMSMVWQCDWGFRQLCLSDILYWLDSHVDAPFANKCHEMLLQLLWKRPSRYSKTWLGFHVFMYLLVILQGKQILQDLEEVAICGGPYAHDSHCRHYWWSSVYSLMLCHAVSCCVLSLSHVPVASPACTLHQCNCYSSITCQQVCTALKQLLSAF